VEGTSRPDRGGRVARTFRCGRGTSSSFRRGSPIRRSDPRAPSDSSWSRMRKPDEIDHLRWFCESCARRFTTRRSTARTRHAAQADHTRLLRRPGPQDLPEVRAVMLPRGCRRVRRRTGGAGPADHRPPHAHPAAGLPDLGARYGYPGFVRLERHAPGCARMMIGTRSFARSSRTAGTRNGAFGTATRTASTFNLSTVPVMFSYWAKPRTRSTSRAS